MKKKLSVDNETNYLVDKGYFNTFEIPKLKQEGKKLYVATPSNFTNHWFIKGEHDFVSEDDGVYFICKGKKKRKGNFKKTKNKYEFRLRRAFCDSCEYFHKCWKGKSEESNERSFTIAKNYVDNKQLWLDYHKETQTKEWKHIYNKRIGKEHNFQDIKANNGLSRFNFRGTRKIKTISLMAGIAYNLKKFQKAIADIGWDGMKLALNGLQ